jgi:ankyrin repeat protein
MPSVSAKIAGMVRPESLKSEEFQPWSRGRGVDVWAMLCAAIDGDLKTIQELVAHDPNLVKCEFEYFQPIRFAVRENHRAVVDFLLENGADPANTAGESLITIARDRGHDELADFLESSLKQMYHMVPEGALVAALIKARNAAQVRALIDRQPELVHAADERGNQPIHWAVLTRQIELVDFLLANGADINAKRPDGARPLDLTNGDYYYRSWYRDLPSTALQSHEFLIGCLVARGAKYDISVAAKIGDFDRVRDLLDEDPASVNRLPEYVSYYSGLPLRCAADGGHFGVVKLLLERGANPNEPEPGIAPDGGALHAAIGKKRYEIVKLLLEHGANPNASVESSANCMGMAKYSGAPRELVDLIASHGGALSVELVCYNDDVETLAAMLQANPQLHFDDDALGNAFGGKPKRIMDLILRYRPDALQHVVLQAKTPEFARWLIERGADPKRGNWLGITPLHRYAGEGNIELAAVCFEFGADINAIDTEYSSTPLGWAARHGRKEMVEWLLQKGANPYLPDDEPWALPAAWAKRRGHREIGTLL